MKVRTRKFIQVYQSRWVAGRFVSQLLQRFGLRDYSWHDRTDVWSVTSDYILLGGRRLHDRAATTVIIGYLRQSEHSVRTQSRSAAQQVGLWLCHIWAYSRLARSAIFPLEWDPEGAGPPTVSPLALAIACKMNHVSSAGSNEFLLFELNVNFPHFIFFTWK